MTPIEALQRILEISYAGHPDGRETRLEMIARIAQAGIDGAPARSIQDDYDSAEIILKSLQRYRWNDDEVHQQDLEYLTRRLQWILERDK